MTESNGCFSNWPGNKGWQGFWSLLWPESQSSSLQFWRYEAHIWYKSRWNVYQQQLQFEIFGTKGVIYSTNFFTIFFIINLNVHIYRNTINLMTAVCWQVFGLCCKQSLMPHTYVDNLQASKTRNVLPHVRLELTTFRFILMRYLLRQRGLCAVCNSLMN